jgi:hypothetical protein
MVTREDLMKRVAFVTVAATLLVAPLALPAEKDKAKAKDAKDSKTTPLAAPAAGTVAVVDGKPITTPSWRRWRAAAVPARAQSTNKGGAGRASRAGWPRRKRLPRHQHRRADATEIEVGVPAITEAVAEGVLRTEQGPHGQHARGRGPPDEAPRQEARAPGGLVNDPAKTPGARDAGAAARWWH